MYDKLNNCCGFFCSVCVLFYVIYFNYYALNYMFVSKVKLKSNKKIEVVLIIPTFT